MANDECSSAGGKRKAKAKAEAMIMNVNNMETRRSTSGCRAGFPACRYAGLSSPVFQSVEKRRWKAPLTGSLEKLPYTLRVLCLSASLWLFATGVAMAVTNDLTSLLQRGLFEEEANRNLDAAIISYESLAKQFDRDRQLAATAVFRLGECYRKLGKTNEAVVQYERIVREFLDQQTLVMLSRQNLSAIAPAAVSFQDAVRPPSEAYEYVIQAGDTLSSIVAAYRKNGVEFSSDSLLRMNPGLNPTRLRVGQKIMVPAGSDPSRRLPLGSENELAEAAANEAASLKAQLDQMKSLKPEQLRVFVQQNYPNPILTQLLGNLTIAEQSLVAMRSNYTTENPRYKNAEEVVQSINKRIDEQIEGVLLGLSIKQNVAEERAKALRAQATQSNGATSAKPAAAGVTDDEEREIRRIQAMVQNSPDLINAPNGNNGTPLFQAAKNGQLRVVAFLLDHGADVNARSGIPIGQDGATWTPLLAAANSGHKAMVELLLSRGADVNASAFPVGSALNTAARNNFQVVVEVLLAHKANIDATDMENNQRHAPLYWAVKNGNTSMVKLLIAKGADVNARTSSGETALHVAAEQGNQEILRSLLDAKADVTVKTVEGNTPLHNAARSNLPDNIRLLLAAGADVNARNEIGQTPLVVAVQRRWIDAAKELLQAKADPNLETKPEYFSGGTPLHFATENDDADMIKLLVASHANINARDRTETTPLFPAVVNGRSKAVVALLEAKADPNVVRTSKDRERWTPLHYAAEKGKVEIVEALLQHGANPDAQTGYSPQSPQFPGSPQNRSDLTGVTPLYLATLNNQADSVKLLLAHKADPNLPAKDTATPLIRAIWNRNVPIATMLLDHGADVNVRGDWNGMTPLHFAVQFTSLDLVEAILAHQPDMNAMDNNGATALDYARGKAELTEIAALLRKHGALDDVPRFDRISVSRPSAKYFQPIFLKGTNGWNRFSLLELIAAHYGFISTNPNVNSSARRMFDPHSFTAVDSLAFPQWEGIVIHRPASSGLEWKKIPVDFTKIFKSGGCSEDIQLEWGDVVEIPEADHPINANWTGFFQESRTQLQDCLKRQVQLSVKGQTTNLLLMPMATTQGSVTYGANGRIEWPVIPFSLLPVLNNSGLLRASSDLSRVKVLRRDPKTGKKLEWVLDCSGNKAPDLWLRDGDMIEVPEK